MKKLQDLLNQLTSGDDAQAEKAAASLVHLDTAALNPLLALLDSPLIDNRWWATRALASFNRPAAEDGLLRSLQDPEPAVRQCAALGLCHYPTPSAISGLINALYDSDRLFARLAADALVAIGPLSIPPLAEVMQSPDPAARIEATRAMANINHSQTIPVLFAALDDPSPMVCYWAEEGLERLGIGMLFFRP